ncbi:MAG: flagellar M-ring protein FliF [Oscillospiraceae bacterium]|jgi:flagellar M-ring protein FliF|nr:flagellar M-ring protein FliF [Oscillospiraceae bacterium]
MRAFTENVLRQIREFFGKMSKKDRVRLLVFSLVIIVLAIIIVSVLNRTNYAQLIRAQSDAEVGEIISALREKNVPYRIEGTTVLVPDNKVAEVRADLAAQGFFANEKDYSFLDQASGFSVTDDTRQKLFEAQRESDIKVSILATEKIQNCYVTLNMGKTSPFAMKGSGSEPTASVVLVLKNGATLSNREAQQIAGIVKTSVPDLKYENITITDDKLNIYSIGDDINVDIGDELSTRIALENLLAQQLQAQGEQLLIPIFGMNSVKVQPHLTLDFDKVNSESIEFAPPVAGELDGIARSSSELYENQRLPGAAEGIPGTDTNGMGPTEYPYVTLQDGEEYRKVLIEKNYEINQTITTIEKERGQIKELSIAVLIDSESVDGDYTTEVTNLVSKAFGCAPANIAVERVPLTHREETLEELEAEREQALKTTKLKELLKTIIVWAVILILGLAFISLIKSIVKSSREPEISPEALLADGARVDYMANDDLVDEMGLEPNPGEMAGDETEADEEVEEIELNTKSPGLEQIERFIDKDPAAVSQLLRNWLTDEE